MNPQILTAIRQEISKFSQSGRFNVQNVQQHEHGGVGSRVTAQTTITYAGVVNTSSTPALLPRGWTVTNPLSDGVYTITHNLDTVLYSVVVTPLDALESGSVPQVLQAKNLFVVTMFAPAGGANNTNFSFALVNINNKSTTPITYVGSLVENGTYS